MHDLDDDPTETAPRRPPNRSPPEKQSIPRGVPTQMGRYEVLFELARGGMGTVYVGRLVGAHGFDRLVAIKVLSEQRGEADLKAFLAEARVTARISHPNVVQTLELGEEDGMPFIVMELVRGISLSMLLRELSARNERLPAGLAAWIVAKAATGLHAAHDLADDDGRALGLVHRDVSPHNILLSYDGRVAVADFGIAKLVDNDPTRSGIVKGKFGYMSPEQALSKSVDRRSDVFALGVVLHEALTGERLFGSKSPLEAVKAIVERTPDAPHAITENVPEEISDVVMIALAKSRDERFSTAKSMAKALREALAAVASRADDSQLATLLEDLFPSQRDTFERRLRRALRGAPDEETPAATANSEPDNALSHTIRGKLGSRAPLWAAALGAVAIGALAFTLTQRDPPQQRDTPEAAAPATATTPTATATTPSAAPAPSPSRVPSASATVSTAPSTPPRPPPVVRRPPPSQPKPPSDADRLFTDIPLPKPKK